MVIYWCRYGEVVKLGKKHKLYYYLIFILYYEGIYNTNYVITIGTLFNDFLRMHFTKIFFDRCSGSHEKNYDQFNILYKISDTTYTI